MQQQSTETKSGLASTFWRMSKVLLFIAPILGLGSLNVLTLSTIKRMLLVSAFSKRFLRQHLQKRPDVTFAEPQPNREKYGGG
ncbi:MAG: hypothetical protein IPK39_17355 [Sulfuritalea sp.]|nr:hypothetical protein [Sulfuritalea sp.]